MLMVHNERLLDFMRFNYSREDIVSLTAFLEEQNTFAFPSLENGLFPAAAFKSDSQDATGYHNVWVRDNFYIAYAHLVAGKADIALKNVGALTAYFKKYRDRFRKIIRGELDADQPMNRPHIRFNGATLEEIDQKWAHAQNDALGYFLWFYCTLVLEGLLKPDREDLDLLGLFPLYFQAIQYWQDEDSGHWEEARKVEASSIGVVAGSLQRLRRVLTATDYVPLGQAKGLTPEWLDELIAKGHEALQNILPAECVQAGKERPYDAALLFLIYPLKAIPAPLADRIINNVVERLQGTYGIRRYRGDSYWAADYKKHLQPEERTVDFSDNMESRDALLKEGEEAQWCIFDPILSIIFGKRYQRGQKKSDLQQQIHYLNRSLGQLTGRDDFCGPFKCPEAYYLENGRYVPNDHTPLLWTQSNLWMALKTMEESLIDR